MDFAAARRDSLVRYLRQHVSGEVRFDDTSRRLYSTDASHYQIPPLGVVLPKTIDDLTVTVQIADAVITPEKAFVVPGRQGIDAVQFRLSDGSPSGTNATFKLTINGVDSNTVLIAVQ